MSCCPPGSVGAVPLSSLKPKGKMVTWKASESAGSSRQPMPCYTIGPSDPKRILLVFSDVFGVDSGNQKVICDTLQEQLGSDTAVYMPDLMRGHAMVGSWGLPNFLTMLFMTLSVVFQSFTRMKDKNIEADLKEIVLPNLGGVTPGVMGFCYGGWVAGRAAILEGFPVQSVVGVHPAFSVEQIFSRKEVDLAASMGEAAPCFIMPAGNDVDILKGTPFVEALKESTEASKEEEVCVEFLDMVHGFVARGDSTDPEIKKNQEKALKLAVRFFDEHNLRSV